jgi:isoquinoline 1-oxidoreductase beta subunit
LALCQRKIYLRAPIVGKKRNLCNLVKYNLRKSVQHPIGDEGVGLALAAERAAWGQPLAPASDGAPKARGIALHESFGSVVAQVAEVSVGKDGAVRVHRVVCAIDCGFPVNPNLIAQQIESAVVFGLSAALHGKVDIEKGQVQPGNFHDYPPLRLDACPVIETHIVPSLAPPEGVGEPGLPPIAPALANALFALTGTRLRHLPLRLPA